MSRGWQSLYKNTLSDACVKALQALSPGNVEGSVGLCPSVLENYFPVPRAWISSWVYSQAWILRRFGVTLTPP